jgi:hypothetical protein
MPPTLPAREAWYSLKTEGLGALRRRARAPSNLVTLYYFFISLGEGRESLGQAFY